MHRSLVLCLVLCVVQVSAGWDWDWDWGSHKNKPTKCGGPFKVKRWSIFYPTSQTDVDTQRLYDDTVYYDKDQDGLLSWAEMTDPKSFTDLDPMYNVTAGVSRCQHVMFETKYYAFDKEVSNAIFDMLDMNNDLVINTQDQNRTFFDMQDKDGDGNVSVCEIYDSFMLMIEAAEHHVYLRRLKWSNLVNKYRKPFNLWKWLRGLLKGH